MFTFSPTLRWRKLIPGVLQILSLVIIAIVILTQMGFGALRGSKITFFARTSQARGLVEGSEIWVAGKQVGQIATVRFLPATSGADRVILELRVLEQYRDLLRRDSNGQIRGGARLISNPVLSITMGSAAALPLAEGDTLPMITQFDAEGAAARAQAALLELPVALLELRRELSGAPSAMSRLASMFFTSDTTGTTPTFPRLVTAMTDLGTRLDSGTIGRIVRDRTLVAEARQALQSLDELDRIYGGNDSPSLRYVRDSALLPRLDSLFVNVRTLAGSVSERAAVLTGTRMDSLSAAMDQLASSVAALKRDMRAKPLRYIVF